MAQTALAVVLAGVLVACSGPAAPDVPSGWPTPTATATVTATATATVRVRAAKGTAKRDRRTGESIDALIALSQDRRKPVRERYLALIRHASFDPGARWDRQLTLTIDKVVWNDAYRDGGKAAPYFNPTERWETIQVPKVLTLVVPRAVPQWLTTAGFVSYVNDYGKGRDPGDVYLLPFIFYYVGDRPVAIEEHYIP